MIVTDQAHPVRAANSASRDAAVRWADRHYVEDPIRSMDVVSLASLDAAGEVSRLLKSMRSRRGDRC